ncbi:MAG: hypothetical protein IJS32_06245 [Kiritimatiellae bacterium]|nr:hypothetical protein [Kiritimatiellia bacterium]
MKQGAKAWVRPAMIVVPLAAGAFFPRLAVLATPPWNAIRYVLMLMVFTSSLSIDAKALRPRGAHFLLLAANLAAGVLPFLALRALFPAHRDFALAAFFCGIAPSATASPVVIGFLGGDVAYALGGFAVSSAGVLAAMVVLLPWATGAGVTAGAIASVALSVATTVLLPLALAMGLRALFPGARDFSKRLSGATFALWAATLAILSAMARTYLAGNAGAAGMLAGCAGIALAQCAAGFALGRRFAPAGRETECSQLLGQKNTTLALYLALAYATPPAAIAVVCYVFLQNLWNAWEIFRHDRAGAARGEGKSKT